MVDRAVCDGNRRHLTIHADSEELLPGHLIVRWLRSRMPPCLEMVDSVCLTPRTRSPMDVLPVFPRMGPRIRVGTAAPTISREEQAGRWRPRFQQNKAGCVIN